MRVLIIDTQPVRRGAQVFGYDLQKWLTRHGHVCSRVYLYRPTSTAALLALDDGDLCLNGVVSHWSERIFVHPVLLWRLRRFINHFAPDIVLANGSRTGKYRSCLSLILPPNIKWVTRIIGSVGYGSTSRTKTLFYKWLVNVGLDGVVGVGQKALDEVRVIYGYRGSGTVIPRALDVDGFSYGLDRDRVRSDFGLAPEDRVLVFVGSISSEKRPDRFLRVFAEVARQFPQAQAWIVGDGPLQEACRAQAAELGVSDKVMFHGYQSDVRPYLSAADVFYLSSDTEGVPGVLLEAASMKLPVVTTDAGDAVTCINDGVSGFSVKKADEQAAISAISALFSNQELAYQMGEAGKKYVADSFSMDEIGQSYLEYFVSL